MEKYFAYRSNMFEPRLRDRCPSARFETIAKLPDFQLEFPRLSVKLNCGVANVTAAPGQETIGVVYSLSDYDLPVLDRAEGVQIGAYKREQREVSTLDGTKLTVNVYIACESGNNYLPSQDYLDFLILGAEEHLLPQEYIDRLRRIPVLS